MGKTETHAGSDFRRSPRPVMTGFFSNANFKILKLAAKSPIYVYRYAISPVIGPRCRHLPTCSQYAIDAIDLNGVWIGSWLTLGRIARCHPWGTHGYDPAPDLKTAGIPFWAPWRYLRYYPRDEKTESLGSG